MKKVILLLLILISYQVFADDIYFKNAKIWENCSPGYIVDDNVIIEQIIDGKKSNSQTIPLNSILGAVVKDLDYTTDTKVFAIGNDKLLEISKTNAFQPIDQIGLWYVFDDKIMSKGQLREYQSRTIWDNLRNNGSNNYNQNLTLENTEKPKYLSGLSSYSSNEIKVIKDNSNISDNQRLLFYYSMRKTAVPECLMNGYGLASMSQGDYEHGAIILAAELLGTLFLSLSSDEIVNTIGYGLVGGGLIYGFVRPIIYADKYNKALKVGLEINYEF
jgi:hypothetical protein